MLCLANNGELVWPIPLDYIFIELLIVFGKKKFPLNILSLSFEVNLSFCYCCLGVNFFFFITIVNHWSHKVSTLFLLFLFSLLDLSNCFLCIHALKIFKYALLLISSIIVCHNSYLDKRCDYLWILFFFIFEKKKIIYEFVVNFFFSFVV